MNLTALLIALPLASSPLIYLVGRAFPAPRRQAEPVCRWLSVGIMLVLWALWTRAALALSAGEALTTALGLLALRIDGLSLLFAALVLSVSTLVLVFSSADAADRDGIEKYYAMLVTTTGALIGMVCARDLFNLWVWFELVVISSFLLVSFERERPAALDASIKYLTQSAVGSVLIVLGIAFVLAQTSSLALDNLQPGRLAPGLLAAGALLIVGFGIKSALVPLHTWLPDVYAEAPTLTFLKRIFGHIFESEKNINQSFVATLIAWPLEIGKAVELHGVRFTPLRVLHGRLPIAGFRIETANDAAGSILPLAYLTDVSAIPPETWPQLRGVRTLVLDALRHRHHPTHLTIGQAVSIAHEIGAEQTYFVHMTHDISHAETQADLPERMMLAWDGLELS